jgi:hypothetical protein
MGASCDPHVHFDFTCTGELETFDFTCTGQLEKTMLKDVEQVAGS